MKYIIEGGQKLKGEIKISGNKNSILPCMAAALLTKEQVILENVPQIADVDILFEIFKSLGVEINREGQYLKIKANQINKISLPEDLVKKLRASILLVGPVLSRKRKVSFHHPGGDIIGRRSIAVHLEGLRFLGCSIRQDDLNYTIEFSKNRISSSSRDFFLEFPSVTGTENLILTSVIGQGRLTLRNCASEPHVVDLCKMLNSMGAQIVGIGTDTLSIRGVGQLKGTNFRIGDDYLEICTYGAAASLTGGVIKVLCDSKTDLEPILVVMRKFGINSDKDKNGRIFSADDLVAVEKIITNIWPGFPTDLMSVMIVLATQARGVTLCHDWIYESRMFFVDKLISMGANITIADPHRVLVYGPTLLRSRHMESPDIRAGMALVLAGLVAYGKSEIQKAELIERGYEKVVEKLGSLGAKISKI